MASGVPVLAIGPIDGDLAEIINKTNTGLISDFGDQSALKNNILKLFENNNPKQNVAEINKYDRRVLTKQLCDLLDGL
jgi:glycosyltransferase involved in cell wall biosynthesis